MGIFIQLTDYAEDKSLYGYSLFGTTLALISLGLFLLLFKEWSIHGPTNLPIVGVESPGYFARVKARRKFVSNGFQIVRDAYYKYYGKNFVITTNSNEKVILTYDQVKELANAQDDTVSMAHSSAQTMMAQHTGLSGFVGTHYVREAVRIELNRNLGNMIGDLLEEAQFAMNIELPEFTTDEWVSVDIPAAVLRIVARISGRAFIGLPLCRNEDWLTLSISFTTDVFQEINKLTPVPKILRPFFAYIWNSAGSVNSHKRKAQSLLAPVFQRRFEEEALAEKNGTVRQNHRDLLQWLTTRVAPNHKNVNVFSGLQLMIGLASVHTTTSGFTNMIFDLAEHQECIQPIREEMETLISANGGVLDRATLRKMRKTDSFFRESFRTSLLLLGFNRMIMKNMTLSDGTYLPKGTLVAAPAAMFSSDPDFVEDPETFDGFRWYKKSLEVTDSAADNNNATNISPTNLIFGYGRHACPGRYFVVEVMKIMLAFMLLQYDIKYPEGQSRPPNIQMGELSYPDRTQKLVFKKRPGPKKFGFLQ
ncbi:cytochrome P450 [Tuber brumale]|nr:cytochrome P450 [Tuber brumale]